MTSGRANLECICPRAGSEISLYARQSCILVDPFSPLHHQCVAWMLSGWSSLHVVGELFMTDGTFPVLLDNLPIQ